MIKFYTENFCIDKTQSWHRDGFVTCLEWTDLYLVLFQAHLMQIFFFKGEDIFAEDLIENEKCGTTTPPVDPRGSVLEEEVWHCFMLEIEYSSKRTPLTGYSYVGDNT